MLENIKETVSSSLCGKKENSKGIIQKALMYIVLLFAFFVVGTVNNFNKVSASYDSWLNSEKLVVGTDGSNGDSYNCLFIFDYDGPTNEYGGRWSLIGAGLTGLCSVPYGLTGSGEYLFGSGADRAKLEVTRSGSMVFSNRGCFLGICGNWGHVRTINLWTLLENQGHSKSSVVGHRLHFDITGGNKTDAGALTVPAYYFDSSSMASVSRDNGNWAKSHSGTVSASGGTGAKSSTTYGCWGTSTSSSCSSNSKSGKSNSYSKSDGTGTYYLNGKVCHTYAAINNGTWDPGDDNLQDFTICDTASSSAMYLDNTAPSAPSFGTNGNSSWAKGRSTTSSASDSHSGMGKIHYCWTTSTTGCTPTSSSSSISSGGTITKNGVTGNYYLRAIAIDAVGNSSSISTSNVFKFDNTAPTFSSFSPNGSSSYAKSYSSVTATFTDGHSGIGATEYCWNTSSSSTSVSSCTSTTSSISGVTGTYYLHARARDGSVKGTESSDYNYASWQVSNGFLLDNTAPVFEAFSMNGNATWAKSRTITVTFKDAHSGMASISYCWSTSSSSCSGYTSANTTNSGQNGTISVSSGVLAGEYYLFVKGKDAVGNESAATTSNVFNLGVAQIGSTEYHTLAGAISAASNGNTIKMLVSVTECVSNSKTLTLSLNGKTISCSSNAVSNTGTLTVNGTGTIKSTGTNVDSSYGIVATAGTVTLNSNVTVEGARAIYAANSSTTLNIAGAKVEGKVAYAVIVYTGANVNVTSGQLIGATTGIDNNTGGIITVSGGSVTGNNGYGIGNYENGQITVSGSSTKISGTSNGIYNYSVEGVITISEAEVTGGTYGISMLQGTAHVQSGAISGETHGLQAAGTSVVNISGGTITGVGYAALVLNDTATINMSEGWLVHGGTDNWSTIVVFGGTFRLTGGSIWTTVTLLEIKPGATANVEGGKVESTGYQAVWNGGTFNLTGGTVIGGYNGIYNESGNINISGGTVYTTVDISDDKGGGIYVNSGTGNINITGGTISSNGSSGIFHKGSGEVNISGGVIGVYKKDSSTTYRGNIGVYGYGPGIVNIKPGAIVNGISYGVLHDSGPLNITGGTMGTATIDSVQYTSIYGVYKWWSGNLVISDGTMTGTEDGVFHGSQGTLTITGGTISGGIRGIRVTRPRSDVTAGLATISGGTFTGYHGLVLFDDSRAVVNGGTFTGHDNGIFTSSTSTSALTVTNGTISGTNNGIYAANGAVDVSGGTISGAIGIKNDTNATLNVSGGTISGTTTGIYNASTATREMVLNGSSYTISVGIGSDSSEDTVVSSLSNTVATMVVVDGVSAEDPAKITGAVSNSNINGVIKLYIGAVIEGTTTNSGQFDVIGGNTGAIINNEGGTVSVTRGSAGAITNNSTSTRSGFVLGGSTYTTTIGIGSDSSYSTEVASITNEAAGKVIIDGQSSSKPATIKGEIKNSVANGEVWLYIDAYVQGAITNAGKLNIIGGTVANITNNAGGTVLMQRGTVGEITNNSTATRSMSLAGTSYTVTVGISSDSSVSATVQSIANVAAGKVAVKGYSQTLKAKVNGAITNSVKTGEVAIYENSEVNGGIVNGGKLTLGVANSLSTTDPIIKNASGFGIEETSKDANTIVYDGRIIGKYSADLKTTTACKGYNGNTADVGCNEIVNTTESGYGFITLKEGNLIVSYLVTNAEARIEINQIPDSVHSTLLEAITNIETLYNNTGSIVMLKNASSCPEIKTGVNITLDLRGKTITCNADSTSGIQNNGTLTVRDTAGGGIIQSSTWHGAYNNGTFTLQSGTLKGKKYGINNLKALTVSGGTLEGEEYGLYNTYNNANAVAISGGTIKATGTYASNITYGLYSTTGTISVSGSAVIQGAKGIHSVGPLNISGGTVTASSYHALSVSGTATISGGKIETTAGSKDTLNNNDVYAIHVNSGGTLTISGGEIKGYRGIYVTTGRNVTISGGSVTGNSGYGINNLGTVTMSKGSVTGASTGIYVNGTTAVANISGGSVSTTGSSGYGIQNLGTLTVSKGNASVETYIYSPNYAIYNQTGTLTISGGIIGQKADGTVGLRGLQNGLKDTNQAQGATISGGTIKGTAYGISNSWGALSITGGTVQGTGSSAEGINNNVSSTLSISGSAVVEGKNYGIYSVATSASAVTISGGTIKSTGTYASNITWAINTTAGTLTISGSPVIQGPKGINVAANATFNMSGGTVESKSYYALLTSGTSEVSGGTIKSPKVETESLSGNQLYAVKVSGKALKLSGSAVVEGYFGIEINSGATLNVNGGEIKGENATAVRNSGTLVVKGGKIVAGTNGILNYATATVEGGTISGVTGISNTVTLTVSGGSITGSTNGIATTGGSVSVNGSTAVINGATIGIEGTSSATITLTAGKIESNDRAVSTTGASKVTVNGATLIGTGAGILDQGGTVEVKGGTITGDSSVYLDWGSKGTISGGTIKGTSNGLFLCQSEVSISNGTIEATGAGITTHASPCGASTVNISGGTIKSSGVSHNSGTITMSGGTILGVNGNGVNNVATINVSGGIITSNGASAIYNTSTTSNGVKISGGTLGNGTVGGTTYNSAYGINNETNGSVLVEGGTVKGSTDAILNKGTVTVSDGVLSGTTYGVNNSGTLSVSGGTISGNSSSGGWGINNTGTVTISQASGKTTLVSGYNSGVVNTGTFTFSGGRITAFNNNGTGTLSVSGGTISGCGYGINNASSSANAVVVTGGTIESTCDGSGAIKTSAGTVRIGTSGGTPSQTTPVITSLVGYGIYETAAAAKVEVYDGKIVGKYHTDLRTTTACRGYVGVGGSFDVGCNEIVDVKPEGYGFTIVYDTAAGTVTQYLVAAGARVERTDPDTVETTIQLAINKVRDYYSGVGTVVILKNATENVSVASGLNITLKLNGMTVGSASTTISNAGTLTVTGTGTIKTTATSGYAYGISNSGTLTINNGTISTDTKSVDTIRAVYNGGTFIMNGGSLDGGQGLRSDGAITINDGTITGYHYGANLQGTAEKIINGGTITATNSGAVGVYVAGAGKLIVTGGLIRGNTGICGGTTPNIEIKGGTITGIEKGITLAGGSLAINGGTVEGEATYAIIASSGSVTYTGGTLKGRSNQNYVYNLSTGVTYSTGTKSEYTVISGSKYVTTLSAAIENSTDGTIATEIGEITTSGTITLSGNVTEAAIDIPTGKHITLNLGGKLLNSYITNRVATTKDSTPFITVRGELTIIGGSIEMYNSLADLIYVEEEGVLNIGRASDTISVISPSLEVKNGLKAVNAEEWSTVNYNNGLIKEGIDKFGVQYNDLHIREGYYIEHTASEMKLVADSDAIKPLGLEPLYSSEKGKDGVITITIDHPSKEMGANEKLSVYLRGQVTAAAPKGKEHKLACTSSGYKTVCTIEDSLVGYIYNAVYENKLLYVYEKTDTLNRLKLIREDLEILPDLKNDLGYIKDPILSLTTTDGKRYNILSDGELVVVDLLDGITDFTKLNINYAQVKASLFGDNWADVYETLNIGLKIVKQAALPSDNGGISISYASIEILEGTKIRDNYEVPDEYTLAALPKILIYDYSPKTGE